MDRKKAVSTLGFIAIMLVVLGAFTGILFFVESRMEKAPLEDSFLENTKEDDFARRVPLQTITIGGQKYNIYHKMKTYLFMGTDNSGNEEGVGEKYQGSMADFLMLVVFDETSKTHGYIQFDRDTMTEVSLMLKNGKSYATAEEQLCTAHWYGGSKALSAENTVQAVSKMLGGLAIDGYYAIGMSQIQAMNHEVGGVEVALEEDFTEFDPTMRKGEVLRLNDTQAEIYLHQRLGVGDESNTARMERQKRYMTQLFRQIEKISEDDATYGTKMFKKFQKMATTNMSLKTITSRGADMKEGSSVGILTFDGKHKLGKALDDGLEHVEFYPATASIVENMKKLYQMEEE